jgi:hypothetical protein
MNKWTQHVKDWAAKHKMKYSEALKDAKCKAAYNSAKGIKKIKGGRVPGESNNDNTAQPETPETPITLEDALDNHRNTIFPRMVEQFNEVLDDIYDEDARGLLSDAEWDRINILSNQMNNLFRQMSIENDPDRYNNLIREVNNVGRQLVRRNLITQNQDTNEIGQGMTGGAMSDYVSAVVKGRKDYPPKMREILKKYGDKTVLRMFACRKPISALTTSALNAVSLGEFNKRWENQPYDKLFHLDLRVEVIDDPKTRKIGSVLLEKNEVLNAVVNPKKAKETECQLILNIPRPLTINKMLEGAKQVLGDKFFTYSAYNNNCQDFIMALLKGVGAGTQENYDFIKQDTKELFKGLPGTRKLANTVTDFAATISTAIQGAGTKPCWKGYEQYGMKMKKGREVPNCIPVVKGKGAGPAIMFDFEDFEEPIPPPPPQQVIEIQGINERRELAKLEKLETTLLQIMNDQIQELGIVKPDTYQLYLETIFLRDLARQDLQNALNPVVANANVIIDGVPMVVPEVVNFDIDDGEETLQAQPTGSGIHKGENYYIQRREVPNCIPVVKGKGNWFRSRRVAPSIRDIREEYEREIPMARQELEIVQELLNRIQNDQNSVLANLGPELVEERDELRSDLFEMEYFIARNPKTAPMTPVSSRENSVQSNPEDSVVSFDLSPESSISSGPVAFYNDGMRMSSFLTDSTEPSEPSGTGIHKGDNYYIQSVVFDKSKFDSKKAREWLKKNNYVVKKPDITDNQIRFRQVSPTYIKQKGFDKFRTKKIGRNSGISLIISYK